jgi:hypothetical protein
MARFVSGRVEWDMLFPEHLARRAKCSGKRQKRTMLPQAKLPFIGSNAWFAHPLRNSCYLKKDKNVPCCRRRNRSASEQTPGLQRYRAGSAI